MRYIQTLALFFLLSCGNNGDASNGTQTADDLERAIAAIEDRKEAELEIIEEQERIIGVLEANLKEANSEGMREKIKRDINEKRAIIRDAEKNLENQERVLGELYGKRDGLKGK